MCFRSKWSYPAHNKKIHSTASLVMVEYACIGVIFTSFTYVPSLVCMDSKYWNDPFLLTLFHSSIYWPVTVDQDFVFIGAHFHALTSSCVLQPFGELLQFFSTPSQKIDVISKLYVAKRSASDGQWNVNFWIICRLIYLHHHHHHHHHRLSSAFHATHRLDVFPQSSSSNSLSPMPTLSLVFFKTLRRLCLAGHIHSIHNSSNKWRIPRDSTTALLNSSSWINFFAQRRHFVLENAHHVVCSSATVSEQTDDHSNSRDIAAEWDRWLSSAHLITFFPVLNYLQNDCGQCTHCLGAAAFALLCVG